MFNNFEYKQTITHSLICLYENCLVKIGLNYLSRHSLKKKKKLQDYT